MATTEFEGWELKLRAAGPMPVGQAGGGSFIQQTFGVDRYRIIIQPATDVIVDSTAFRGQFGDLISASYNRLQDKSGLKFSARLVYNPTFEDESILNNG